RPQAVPFPGGLTAQEFSGLAHEVYHCDVQSLYPSIITHWNISPAGDSLRVFTGMLEQLRSFRLQAKEQAGIMAKEQGQNSEAYRYYNSLQTVFKVLINSFYGYLGFEQGNFADFEAAAAVTAKGREILQGMIAWLKERGCTIIEVDTDGIYFMAPEALRSEAERQKLIADLNATLPEAINLDFDGHYRSMYCHKMKNYALLDYDDRITLRGSALRARNMEPFLRETLEAMLSLVLHDRAQEISGLLQQAAEDLSAKRIPIAKLAKTDTLISSLDSYTKKSGDKARNRAAAYELALQSGRDYKAGDKVTYYVTGTAATVSVWQNAKLLSANTGEYDANIKYYLSKLKDLAKKFSFT
ncbi:DNA polymerase II, partial [bacterium]|nr:DNA polymerase II [bacterium]